MTIRSGTVLDQYSVFDYKVRFDATTSPDMLPQWVGDHARRLHAYSLLHAYVSNASRFWLEESASEGKRREYGDPFILTETALVSLIGDRQRVVVDGAVASTVEGEVDDTTAPAVKTQELIDQWIEDEKFFMKMVESERQSIKYGDSVYVLVPDAKKKRPRLHVYDPGFYFPVFDPLSREGSEDFPTKVHIAWEFQMVVDGKDVDFVRRITWELVPVTAYRPEYANEEVTMNCQYTDAYWRIDQVGKDLTIAWGPQASFVTEPTMMNIDFIPVVHVPNGVALQNHFGTSVLGPVMQILDDIQATDTDLQAAAATTGTPPIAITGRSSSNDITSYGPGAVFYCGDGQATVLDTSQSLVALLSLKDALLERLSVNSRTPEALLGRVKPNEVPSGISMTLSFAPHTGMIKEMRLVRMEKYPILFKFVLRLMGIKDPPKVQLIMGSFLPADKQEAVSEIVQLMSAQAISLETAVQMLMESGFPIEDMVMEISRIQARDTETATSLMTLTGDPNTGLKFMGRPTIEFSDDPMDDTGV